MGASDWQEKLNAIHKSGGQDLAIFKSRPRKELGRDWGGSGATEEEVPGPSVTPLRGKRKWLDQCIWDHPSPRRAKMVREGDGDAGLVHNPDDTLADLEDVPVCGAR